MSGHTPGPWEVYDQGKDDGPEYGAHIKSADPMYDWVANDIPNMADARLIAAAPELLALLKEFTWDEDGIPNCHPVRDRIDAAIAKAEGR